MSMAQSYKGWHNTEAVTVTFKRQGVANVSVPISVAKRSAVDEQAAMAAGVRLTGEDLFFHIPVALLEASEDYPGSVQNADFVTDGDGVNWVVKHHQLLSYGTRYKLLCSQSRAT